MLILTSQDLVERCHKFTVILLLAVLCCSSRGTGLGVITPWWNVRRGGIPPSHVLACVWPELKIPTLTRTDRTSRQMSGHIFRCNAALS